MKSTTKLILAGLGTAAICAGVYYAYKNKDKFLKTEEVINPDGTAEKRTYVVLDVDGAKKKATDSIQKGKEKAQDPWKKVENGAKEKRSVRYTPYHVARVRKKWKLMLKTL